jgi:RHS repeat-associated protein
MNPRAYSSRSNVEWQAFNRPTYSVPAPFGLYVSGFKVNFMQQATASTSRHFSHPAFEVTQESYYRARYYDPSTGRFLSEDPLGSSVGVNNYSAMGNNPVKYSDAFGLDYNVNYDPKTNTVFPLSPCVRSP